MSGQLHASGDRDAWIGIQRKTFSRWANQYLPAESKIENLVTDLNDGIVLAKLLSKISNESVGNINTKPRMDIQKLENLNQSLNFIKKHDIPLVNIGSSDILKGNEKLVLGLLWTVILRFEVSGADGKAGLLLWLQRSTKGYEGVDVKDFTNSWKDGLAFNALIHRYRPDLVDFNSLSSTDALGNCDKAFGIAEKDLKIARLLDPEDVVEQPDEKSQVAYLSQFFKLFAGQAKIEAKLKAVKNAVEVTQRHDGWIEQYEKDSQVIMNATAKKKEDLGKDIELSTTEQVKEALDAYDSYMKDEKPALAASRAEMEGIFSTLSSSKRNNNRPEFKPTVSIEQMNAEWDSLEQLEQMYERKMLDKYLAFQMADHVVSKYNAKSATVSTWLEEKAAIFEEGSLGTSVPEIEASIEMHTSYENRMALYQKIMGDLEDMVAKGTEAEGHSGLAEMVNHFATLQARMTHIQELGKEHRAKLEKALENEQFLVAKEKDYLHQIDNLDFAVDDLEELVNEDDVGATAAEMRDVQVQVNRFESEAIAASEKLANIEELAQEIQSKRPDALAHCQEQRARLDAILAAMKEKLKIVQTKLEEGQLRDKLSKEFADLANEFADYCEAQRTALGSLPGTLEEQKEALAIFRENLVGEAGEGTAKLQKLQMASDACDEAHIVANRYTPHTIYTLRSEYEQLIKATKRSDDALTAQLMAQKALQIPPEQLKEIQEIFGVFDHDQDGKLRLADLKEACLGAGIDMDDDVLEERMRARKSNMLFTLDDFVAFFVEEVQTGDSEEDVINALKSVSGGSGLTKEQIETTFGPISRELAGYLASNIVDGDFESFAHKLFTR